MEEKRKTFPRFFFVSPADLLDILSNGNSPAKVMVHMPKIISAIDTLELVEDGARPSCLGMHAGVGKEYVKFTDTLKLDGKVESYLHKVIDVMRSSLRNIATTALNSLGSTPREQFIQQNPAQVCLLINVVTWVINVEKGFQQLPNDPNAI